MNQDTTIPNVASILAAINAGKIIGGAEPRTGAYDRNEEDGVDAMPFVIVPKDCDLKSLEHLLQRDVPKRRTASVTLYDPDSFAGYVNAFKVPETRLFADIQQRTILAIVDYHEGGAAGKARWGSHRATLTLRATVPWATWSDQNGKPMTQAAFAAFIEDNLVDVASPDGSVVLAVSRSMEATKGLKFSSDTRLDNGQVQFAYHETVDGAARINERRVPIPPEFILALAPFEGAEPYKVTARLRYRIQDGKLQMWFDLLRPQRIVEDAFGKVLETVGVATGSVILRGQAPAAFS